MILFTRCQSSAKNVSSTSNVTSKSVHSLLLPTRNMSFPDLFKGHNVCCVYSTMNKLS